jgi:hypothetical protein
MNNFESKAQELFTFFKAEDTPGTVLLGSRQKWQDRTGKNRLSAQAAP